MKTVGIIAEYNPFHSGHLYQMNMARRLSAADYVIVVMSPDFVQRGAPALTDKWVRARTALECGADLVLELPVRWASSSAEYFAMGAVSLLSSLNVTDCLSFGYEQGPFETLEKFASFQTKEEPAEYASILKDHLRRGMSFARARCQAYLWYSGLDDESDTAAILSSPNNILAIEYLKAIKRLGNAIEPVPVMRVGSGYHAKDIVLCSSTEEQTSEDAAALQKAADTAALQKEDPLRKEDSFLKEDPLRKQNPFFASASGIREAIARGEDITGTMPENALSALREEISAGRCVTMEDLDLPLRLALFHHKTSLSSFLDISDDLANRIEHYLPSYRSIMQFTDLIKTKQIAYTRVQRALLHVFLGIKKTDGIDCAMPSFARVLGFRRSASGLLHAVSGKSKTALISKLPRAGECPAVLQEDLHASDLWELLVSHKTGKPARSEYQRQIIVI